MEEDFAVVFRLLEPILRRPLGNAKRLLETKV
jgi:hypothetical protein